MCKGFLWGIWVSVSVSVLMVFVRMDDGFWMDGFVGVRNWKKGMGGKDAWEGLDRGEWGGGVG